jgi:hypothetical protein
VLGMARHCGRIPWEALRDDTAISAEPAAYDDGPGHFHTTLLAAARDLRLDRRTGQQVRLEAWSETAGKVPQLVTVAGPYGVPVYSGSGFNSLPGKRDAALHAPAGGHRTPMRERIARLLIAMSPSPRPSGSPPRSGWPEARPTPSTCLSGSESHPLR